MIRVPVKSSLLATGLLVGLTVAAGASPVAAQSLFGSRGLGLPTAPIDARAAALGGLGLALPGANPAMINPAEASGVPRRGGIASYQPSTTDLTVPEGSDAVDATRFPLVQAFLPVGERIVLLGGFGSFLDQNWAVERTVQTPLGENTVQANDRITSRGGIAQARVGASYALTPQLALGVSGGMLTGSRTHTVRRTFSDSLLVLSPYQDRTDVAYTAPLAAAGFRWDPMDIVRVGGSVTWIGSLDVDRDDDGPDTSVSMPLQLAGGASVYLDPDLLATVSGRWNGWSGASDDLARGAEDSWEVGGGLEYLGIRTTRRSFPVRLGGRYAKLPFPFEGATPSEWAVSAGLGARLTGTEEEPAAVLNASAERGARGDLEQDGLEESFWRFTVSLSLFSP